jgi:hypothetical protein
MGNEATRRLLAPCQKSLDRDQRVIAFGRRGNAYEPPLDLLVGDLADLLAPEREVSTKKTLISANRALAVLFFASTKVLLHGVIPPNRPWTMLAQSQLSENSPGLKARISK